LLPIVLPAVEFDHQFPFAAREVDDKWPHCNLSPEMRSDQLDIMTESLPKHSLGFRRLCAHPTRKISLTIIHPIRFHYIGHHPWTPTPDPSPQGGGERMHLASG
jgi:hypothetical protein